MSKKISEKDKRKIRRLIKGMKMKPKKIKRQIEPIYDETYFEFMSLSDSEIETGKKKKN